MKIENLSGTYLVRPLTESDVEAIYNLSKGNPLFFEYCPPFVTRQSILEDMKALPPNVTNGDKHYVGFFAEERLVALLDLITHYPNPATAFIGLFMVAREEQGRGVGTAIVTDCATELRALGYNRIRLGFAKGNPQSEAFWQKNGFHRTGEEYRQVGYTVVVMERELV